MLPPKPGHRAVDLYLDSDVHPEGKGVISLADSMRPSKRARAPFSVRPAGILALLLIALASVAASVTPAVAKERRAEIT